MTEETKKAEVPKEARGAMKANIATMFNDPVIGGGKKVGIVIVGKDGTLESFVAFDSPEQLQNHRAGTKIPDRAYVVAPDKEPIHISNLDQLKAASIGIGLAPDTTKPAIAAPKARPEEADKDKPIDTKAFEDKELQYGSGFKHGTKDGKGKADASEREAVKQAQLALMKLDIDVGKGGADGRLGSDTLGAINKFEKENGIEPPSENDGNKPLNKETLKKLAEKVKEKEKAQEKDKEKVEGKDAKPDEKKPEEKAAAADMITVKPKKDMTVDEMAQKLGVDKDKQKDFKNAMDDALGGKKSVKGGEEVQMDAKKYGISPGDQHSAAAKGVDVKKSTGRA